MDENLKNYRIHDLEKSDRPRERMGKLGPQALNSAELIAILIRVGVKGENAVQVAHRLLQEFDGLAGLHRASIDEVQAIHGIGFAKAVTIKAAIELGRRLSIASPEDRPTIGSPEDVANLVQFEMSSLEQEHLRVLLLNTRNQVLDIVEVYQGSINSSVVRVGEIFAPAVRRKCASIIVVHNHPSGDPTPSTEDIAVTHAMIEAGKLLDIEILDHIVIGQGAYISLKEKGLAFKT